MQNESFPGELQLTKEASFLPPVLSEMQEVESLIMVQAARRDANLQAALQHLMQSGGKRIRPNLALLVGKMINADHEALIRLAAALELLHTATLVHDDFIDGSLLRRGIPTLNSQWSSGATVLTGDYLFACSAKLAAETNSIAFVNLFCETLKSIVSGEITQLFSGHCSTNREDYYQRIYAKTASLFETSSYSPVLISNAGTLTQEKMQKFGYEIGMAFQIIDDILDFNGEQETLGKPVGGDLLQGIVTLPAIYYFENHADDPLVQNFLNSNCEKNSDQIHELISRISSSDAIQLAHQEAKNHVKRGVEQLRDQPDGIMKRSLEEMAYYIIDREI